MLRQVVKAQNKVDEFLTFERAMALCLFSGIVAAKGAHIAWLLAVPLAIIAVCAEQIEGLEDWLKKYDERHKDRMQKHAEHIDRIHKRFMEAIDRGGNV